MIGLFAVGAAFWTWFQPGPWEVSGDGPKQRFGEKVFTAGDVDGDGHSDPAVFSSGVGRNAGRISVFHGSSRGPSRIPSFQVDGEAAGDQFGHSFGGVGDVNGDGFGDLIVAAQNHDAPGRVDAGKAYLYLGSKDGLRPQPAWTRHGDAAHELFGDCSAGIGDVNGDGRADVLIGAYGLDRARGAAYLFLGTPEGLSRAPAWKAEGESRGDWFGYSVAPAGDVNGDGSMDVVIGAKKARNKDRAAVGKVYVYHGSPKGFPSRPSWTGTGEREEDMYGWRALSAGDVNGDGFADLIVSSYMHDGPGGPESGKVYVHLGSRGGLGREPAWTFTGDKAGSLLGITIAALDLDQDGFSDLLVGAPGRGGLLHLFRGGPDGPAKTPSWSAQGEPEAVGFGSYVGFAGDVDGDGFPDFLVGIPGHSGNGDASGMAKLYHGDKSGRPRP